MFFLYFFGLKDELIISYWKSKSKTLIFWHFDWRERKWKKINYNDRNKVSDY